MNQTPTIEIKIRLQRLALLWEKLWAALHWPILLAALMLALILSGVLNALPRPWPMVFVVALIAAFLFSLTSLLELQIPTRLQAMRKLEQSSNLQHRETSSLDDQLVSELNQSEIWEEHQRRKLAALENLKIAAPQSRWRMFDPIALRLPAALVLVAAWFLGSGDMMSNFNAVTQLSTPIPQKAIVLDAWLKPPTYTGKAPLLLSSPAMVEKLKQETEILIPENATLSLHLQNATKPRVEAYEMGDTKKPITLTNSKTESTDQGFMADIKLDHSVTIKIFDGTNELATYPLSTIADQTPKIEIVGEPFAKGLGQLHVKWQASDDYGIKTVTAEISLADEQDNGLGFEGNGVFLFDPPALKIAVQQQKAKTIEQESTGDFSAHAWAGLYAELTLTATDAAGHTSTTKPQRFKMPEREFTKPLAQALVEQRKKLILSPDNVPDVSTMLQALLLYPVDLQGQSGLILNLASLRSRLSIATETDTVVALVKDFWPLILAVEEGHVGDLRAELKALKEQLEQALRDGSSQERIDELMRKMREAMNKFMDQMQKDAQHQKPDSQQQSQNGKSITPEDLQKMMDAIEKLQKNGSKDAAQQLLSQLDQLLQNLKPGQGGQAKNGTPGMQNQMDALSELMGKQQKLMDETQRMGQQGKGLGDKQKGLKDQAEKLGKGMGQGMDPGDGDPFGEAGKNMDKAEGALRGGDKQEALRQQGEALKKLREGAQKLAEKMAKGDQQGQDGQGKNSDNDPLGRPRATHDPSLNSNKNQVPSELAIRRAREILEQLRNRFNDQGLDDKTKSYIDRLLKGLY